MHLRGSLSQVQLSRLRPFGTSIRGTTTSVFDFPRSCRLTRAGDARVTVRSAPCRSGRRPVTHRTFGEAVATRHIARVEPIRLLVEGERNRGQGSTLT